MRPKLNRPGDVLARIACLLLLTLPAGCEGRRARPQDLLGREGPPPGDEGDRQDGHGRHQARGVRGRGSGGHEGRQPGPGHGPLPADRLQPGARGNHPGHERQPDLHRRQAPGSGRLRLGVRQGPDRRGHAVPADGAVRAGQRSADRRRGQRPDCREQDFASRPGLDLPDLDDSLAEQPDPRPAGTVGGRLGLGGRDGRDDADRDAAGRRGVQPASACRCWRPVCGRWAWPRWRAGPPPST